MAAPATAWAKVRPGVRDLLFYWGLKRKFETPAMVFPLVARGSMAQAQLYHGQSGLLTTYLSIVKCGKPRWLSHRHGPHGKWPSFKYCENHDVRGLLPQHHVELHEQFRT